MTTTLDEAEAVYREAVDRYMRLLAEGNSSVKTKDAAVRAWSARQHERFKASKSQPMAKVVEAGRGW